MGRPTPFERLGDELEAAAQRQARAASPPRGGRPRRVRTLAALVAALVLGAVAAAWAASSLLSSGDPVPYERGAPVWGRAQGAPVPGSVRMLTDDVADPDGGPPWGMRYWQTDRGFGCLQVGRMDGGRLGQITGKVFHELRVGVTGGRALGGCYLLDGSGHAFVALHLDTLAGGQPEPCPPGLRTDAVLNSGSGPVRCRRGTRTLDFGLLGPNAESYTYRTAGRSPTATPLGAVGGYLVVQRRLRPVIRTFGFHHRDPRLDLRGPAEPAIALTPASQTFTRIAYRDGRCAVRVTSSPYGACRALAGYTPIPQPRIDDVRAPIRAFAAPDGRGIRVRFRAPQTVVDGRSGYAIEVRPVDHRRGFVVADYLHDVRAGQMVRTTVDLYNHRRGPYRIVVRFRSVKARPGPMASLAWPGLVVGQRRVVVP